MSSPRRIALGWALASILVSSLGLFWGIPEANAPKRLKPWGSDGLAPIGPVAELHSVFTGGGRVNPQYPLFEYFVQALFCAPYYLWLLISGGLSAPTTTYPFGLSDPVSAMKVLTFLCRLPNVLMAAGVVVLARATARRMWSRMAGELAALSVLTTYTFCYYSRTSNVDMGALFWSAAGLFLFLRCLEDGLDRRRAVALGTVAALATATKDPAYAKFVVIGVVVLAQHFRASASRPRDGRRWALPLLALGTSLGVYLFASGFIFNPTRYWTHVDFVLHGSPGIGGEPSHFYFSNPATPSGYATVFAETAHLLVASLGLPLALAGVAGLTLCAVRRRLRALLLVLPAVGLFVGVILPVRFALIRFVLFPAYTLALFAGVGLAAGLETCRRRRWFPVMAATAALVFVWSGVRITDLTLQMIHDSRVEVGRWIARNARAGDVVGVLGGTSKLPRLPADVEHADMFRPLLFGEWDGTREGGPEFLLLIPHQSMDDPLHEVDLPPTVFERLTDGSAGYRPMLAIQSPSLFRQRPIPFVNPPVIAFVATDILDRLTDRDARLELPGLERPSSGAGTPAVSPRTTLTPRPAGLGIQ